VTGAALVAALAALLQAPAPAVPEDSTRGRALRVYLLTFDSGAAIWERFGHNALWIHDPINGTDQAYDYGRFSFGEPGFVLRFAQGDLRYWMGSGPADAYLTGYRRAGRRIWLQELDLTAASKLELQRFLEWNAREENKHYDYDYYLDNCSTRIRDAIDRAVGGQLRRFGDSVASALTFRAHTRRLTENNPLLYTALMIGLGQPVDRRITAWEEMFLPIELRPHLNRVVVRDADGRPHPLVTEQRLLYDSDRFPVPARPRAWTPRFLALGLLLGLGLAAAGRGGRRSPGLRRAFAAGAVGWALLSGLAGLVLASLWGLTDHRFSGANENLLQFSVLSLGVAMTLSRSGWPAGTQRMAGIVAGVSLVGLGLKAVPGFDQANLDVIGFALPIHLGVWAGAAWSTRRS
jgi:hypothetical protein